MTQRQYKTGERSKHKPYRDIHSQETYSLISMFVEHEDNIAARLQRINLKETNNMQPRAERPPVCPKAELPQLHLTTASSGGPKKSDSISSPGPQNPWLLRPQHEIPSTPPPKIRSQSEFFPQRIG